MIANEYRMFKKRLQTKMNHFSFILQINFYFSALGFYIGIQIFYFDIHQSVLNYNYKFSLKSN